MANRAATGASGAGLGKGAAIFAGGFLGLVIVLAILELVGVPGRIIAYVFVLTTLAVYAGIGIASRTMLVSDYFVAGRRVSAFHNGMAAAANWFSGASFLGLAGIVYLQGYDGLAFLIGWSGGFVLMAVLLAPYLRRSGCYTVPDFLGARFGGNPARLAGIVVLVGVSFALLVAQLYAIGLVASRFLAIDAAAAIYAGLAVTLLCSLLGGMRAVTWTQLAQLVVLTVAFLLPAVLLSAERFGNPVPQLAYAEALQETAAMEGQLAPAEPGEAASPPAGLRPFAQMSPLNFYALILCLMAGTASLPHVLARSFTTTTVSAARRSVAWALLFVGLLFLTVPAYAAFARLELLHAVAGASIEALPQWVHQYGRAGGGLVTICGVDAVSAEAVRAACAALGRTGDVVRPGDVALHPNMVVMALPQIAGLPSVLSGLLAAGALAAALSTASGLALAVANSLAHDGYYRMASPQAPTGRRLLVARLTLIGVAAAAAYVAAAGPGEVVAIAAWAFSLAAAGYFPALVLGIWWKRCTTAGALAGMVAGFGITLLYLVVTRYFPAFGVEHLAMGALLSPATGAPVVDVAAALADPATADAALASQVGWLDVSNLSAAIFGLPAGFAAAIAVSLLTPEPPQATQAFVEAVRRPRGTPLIPDRAA